MLNISLNAFLINLKSLTDVVNKVKVDNRNSDKNKAKTLSTSSALLKKLIRADYPTSNTKKTFNFLQNTFI